MGRASKLLNALVVEDSEDDYGLLLNFLRRQGYGLHAARVDTRAGLAAALAAGGWDLVISDHQLPGFSSQEALAMVRAAPNPLPFIIVSGVIGEAVAVDAMLAGADDFVLKGHLARLPPAIERSLEAAAERRRHAQSEAARLEADARLSGIARNLPGVLLQIGFDPARGAVLLPYISEGTRGLFGVEAAALMAAPERFERALQIDDRAGFIAHLRAAARDHSGLSWEGRVNSPGTEPTWILVAASWRDSPSGAALWDGLVMNLTAQKAAENVVRKSRQRLRELSAHLEAVKEQERTEAAREIHDDLGGLLTGLKVDLDWLRRNAGAVAGAAAKIEDMSDLTDRMAEGVRRVARSLRPAILDQGLVAALEWLARDFRERTGLAVTFNANVEELPLTPLKATALFRSVQESLTNIAKHAQARRVDVDLFARGDEVAIEVRDDGRGLTPDDRTRAGSFGLHGMEDRLRHLGGWLDISGEPGKGTTVMLFMPLAGPEGQEP